MRKRLKKSVKSTNFWAGVVTIVTTSATGLCLALSSFDPTLIRSMSYTQLGLTFALHLFNNIYHVFKNSQPKDCGPLPDGSTPINNDK